MRSLRCNPPLLILFFCAASIRLVASAVVPLPPDITPAPQAQRVDVQRVQRRQEGEPDALSLINILITALPQSLRQIAATNVPAVSSILWTEFLDDKRPEWFRSLPVEIQRYLIEAFGPVTAAPPESGAVPTGIPASVTSSGYASTTGTGMGESGAASATTVVVSESRSRSAAPTVSSSQTVGSVSSALSTSQAFSSSSSPSPSSPSPSSPSPSSSSPSSTTTTTSTPSSSAVPTDPIAPAPSNSGLTQRQKLSIGIGIPFALLFLSALSITCCIFLRRRRKKSIEGSQPPSSPGFIPRFSFQQGDADGYTVPLARGYSGGAEDRNWDDDGYDVETSYQGHTASAVAMQDSHMPMLAPALYHSHSSNRARGRQISLSSLHSVAEMREPEDESYAESPVLGRYQHQKRSLAGDNRERDGVRRSVKRKPVPVQNGVEYAGGVDETDGATWAGNRGAQQVSRPALASTLTGAQYSGTGSSSSGLAVSSLSSSSFDAYLEDYGPEYYYGGGGYGGNYTQQEQDGDANLGFRYGIREGSGQNNGKTEWPLMSSGIVGRRLP